MKPKLYIIAGCNGAGKTTASYTVLPDMLDCAEFVNADEIAKGLSLERVLARVLAGGHNIPEDVIRRRYKAGLRNLSNIYIPLCDYWMIIDNSYYPSQLIAEGNQNLEEMVYVEDIYKKILEA